MVRYTGGQRWPRKSESGRVPEWPMGTDCKSAAFQLRWFESTRAHQKSSTHERALSFLFYTLLERALRVDSSSCGAVAEDSAKTAQWAVFSSAACVIHPRPPKSSTHERAKTRQDGCGKRKKHVDPPRINVPFWSEQRDLNPRPLRPERSALPTALCPENTAAFRLRSGWG